MQKLQYCGFGTGRYEVIVTWPLGFFIRRKSDGAETMIDTCIEGADTYDLLKRTWRSSREEFDKMCGDFEYYEGGNIDE